MTLKKPRNKPTRLISIVSMIVLNLVMFSNLSAENKLTNPKDLAPNSMSLNELPSNNPSLNDKSPKSDQLNVTPKRCVALREGQTCYQHIIFEWQTKKRLEYCLYLQGKTSPINCWPASSDGRLKFDFQSSESKRFVLRPKNSHVEIATTEVVVAWVYGNKKRRRASWRLF